MKVIEIAGGKVIEVPFKIKDRAKLINTVETSIGLLTYVKPKVRQLIVPGLLEALPDEIPGGLFKTAQTPEGTLYSSGGPGPGIQIESNIYFDEPSLDLFKSAYELIVNLHNEKTGEINLPKYQHGWYFINKPSNREAGFHEHSKFNSSFPHDPTTYTWTTYVQLPDNCEGDEGKLAFQDRKTGRVELIEVQLDTIYIFSAQMLHQPNLSPNSTLNRITAAGNILIPASENSLFSE